MNDMEAMMYLLWLCTASKQVGPTPVGPIYFINHHNEYIPHYGVIAFAKLCFHSIGLGP